MSSTGNYCVVLAVGLVFLSLCNTGQALQCYSCRNWGTSKCETTEDCTSPNNACMKITIQDGNSQYGCRVFDKCTSENIKQEMGLENLHLTCCQTHLCNSSVMVYPSTVLLLGLVAALLMMSP